MPIVISKSRKDYRFAQMVNYVAIDKQRHDPEDKRYMIFHNFNSIDLDDVVTAFRENSRYLPKRKNGNIFYHEYISFDKEDAPFLTKEFLEETAREYLRLRAPKALAYGNIHWNPGKAPHVHLVISANNYRERKRLSISRTNFKEIHRQLEKWQQARIPELRSIVTLGKEARDKNRIDRDRTNRSEREKKLRIRLREERQKKQKEFPELPSIEKINLRKDVVKQKVRKCLNQATGFESFQKFLQAEGFQAYQYRGKLAGIKDERGKKYRFTRSLGIEKNELLAMEKGIPKQRKRNRKSLNRNR